MKALGIFYFYKKFLKNYCICNYIVLQYRQDETKGRYKMTAVERFTEIRRNAEYDDCASYLSCTLVMLARISKLVERYMADAELDYELEVLNDKEYADKQRAYKLMRSTLEDAEIY